jgi:septal ring factor EnvC (AmiA/AmiB activator)
MHRALERDQLRERELHKERVRVSEKLSELNVRRAPLELQGRALAQAEAALLSEQDRERAFQRAFLSSAPSAHTAVYGAGTGPDDIAAPTGFAALRGRLPFPIPGRSEISSARRAGSEGPGLELAAPTGSPVRAVCGGRVAFADAYADYGKTVILDHGDKYYTVSANLERIDVRVGEEISAGARVGSVGQSPMGSKLYFEIRAGNQVVDPAEWFGI